MNQWWKEKYALQPGETGFWQIGPIQIRISRSDKEMVMQWMRVGDPLEGGLAIEVPSPRGDLGGESSVSRIGVQRTDGVVSLRPLLGDRTIIVNPESMFSIPGHEEMVMYVTSPLWIEVSIGKTPKNIIEIPAYRLSDTWFGPSTLDGELCYASKTSARREAADLPFRHHQAFTEVKIRNNTADVLNMENVKLPVRLLALFVERNGRFWTNTVNFVREESGSMAILRLGESPPPETAGSVRVAKPRDKQDHNILVRAFGGLIR